MDDIKPYLALSLRERLYLNDSRKIRFQIPSQQSQTDKPLQSASQLSLYSSQPEPNRAVFKYSLPSIKAQDIDRYSEQVLLESKSFFSAPNEPHSSNNSRNLSNLQTKTSTTAENEQLKVFKY